MVVDVTGTSSDQEHKGDAQWQVQTKLLRRQSAQRSILRLRPSQAIRLASTVKGATVMSVIAVLKASALMKAGPHTSFFCFDLRC